MLDLWHGFGVETKAAIISACATLFAATSGALAIIYQIKRQGNLNRDQVEETERRRIKAEIFSEAFKSARRTMDAEIEFSTSIRTIAPSHALAFDQNKIQGNFQIPKIDTQKILDKFYKLNEASIELIFFVEKISIIDVRLFIFKTAFNFAIVRLNAEWKEYFSFIIPFLPFPEKHPMHQHWQPASPEYLDKIFARGENLLRPSSDLIAFLHDFQREMQNLLFGDLFKSEIPLRQPKNPEGLVITLANHEALQNRINELSKTN